MRPRAIFADMGDVLVGIAPSRFFSRLRALAPGLSPEEFYRNVLGRDVYQDFARGLVDAESFAREVGAIIGVDWDFETFRDVWTDMMDDIPGNAEAFRLALTHVPVHVLSNTDPVHVEYLMGRFPWIEEATGHFFSYELGLLKPDPRFYARALDTTHLDAPGVLFIDDRIENVRTASLMGLLTVHATDRLVFQRTVRQLFG
jgi:HAD superfamily hydrolase (TIGR01509 family)